MTPIRFGAALTLIALGSYATTAVAQSGDDPSPCASITDDKSRLQCYDAQEALRTRKRPAASTAVPGATSPAPEARTQVSTPAPVASTPATAPVSASVSREVTPAATAPVPARASAGSADSEFGLEGQALAKKRAAETPKDAPSKPEQLVATIKSVTGRGKGDYRFELDNGQLWVESQRTGGEPPAIGETVTIRPGLLGSYFLEREKGLALRVKRVK